MKGSAKIYEIARRNPDLGFVLCGRYDDAPALENLRVLGILDRDGLATALRSCHVLLTFSRNEACPNHVLEGLSCGLPVLYDDSGAMPEVVGECGFAVTVEGFPEQLARVMDNHAELSRLARKLALDRFHPEHVFPRYLQEMEAALTRPTLIAEDRRSRMAWAELVLAPSRGAKDFLCRQAARFS